MLFYKVSEKEILEERNKVFVESGLPSLKQKKFVELPHLTSCFGKDEYGDYTYDLCRINNVFLEKISVEIVKGDKWIKIFLNIFKLEPKVESIEDLKNISGLQYVLPPNSRTKMRLREDDFKGMPLFNFVHHCIGSYKSKSGFKKRLNQLGKLIEKDMNNIDLFIKRWHEMHTPLVTDWEGHVINKK